MKLYKTLTTLALALMFVMVISTFSLQTSKFNAYAITVTPTLDPNTIKNALLAGGGSGIDPSSVTVTISGNTAGPAVSVGTYVNPTHTYGIGDGIMLSTGNVTDYGDGPNLYTYRTTDFNNTETAAQKLLLDPITGIFDHYDVTQIDVTFNMLPGNRTVFFNTVFGSEEYPEYVGSVYIDGFGLYVNGHNVAYVNGNPVNINHPDMSFLNGTELDGILLGSNGTFGPAVHTFSAPVNQTGNKLTFIIADSSDHVLDSTVYISALGGSAPPCTPNCLQLVHIDTVLSKSSITLGDSFTDSATLTNATSNATGTVTYSVYNSTANCIGTPLFSSSMPVTDAKPATSSPFTPTMAGTYNIQALYSGDLHNSAARSACSSETLKVTSGTSKPTITTSLSTTKVILGGSITDSATLAGVTSNAGGKVTYNFYNGTAFDPTHLVFTSTVKVTNGIVPNSAPFTPTKTGIYTVQAKYTGDINNKIIISNKCGTEVFHVVVKMLTLAHIARPIG